jgi:hypothetical protein
VRKVVFIHAAGRLAEGSGPLVAYLEDELGAGFIRRRSGAIPGDPA